MVALVILISWRDKEWWFQGADCCQNEYDLISIGSVIRREDDAES